MNASNSDDQANDEAQGLPDQAGCTPTSGPIWLVGMMGVGKSTIGPMLARHLGRAFLDTDHQIEAAQGRKVKEIFEAEGEAAFRLLERDAIARAAQTRAVVALGGGAIAQPGAPERLRSSGTLVYLKATPDQLLRRIASPESRPLLAGLGSAKRRERLAEILAERAPCYEQATLIFDTGHVSMEQASRELARAIQQHQESAP